MASLPATGEADRHAGVPHPRSTRVLIGHADHERELLDAYRQNRLPHAIILGGPQGVGKATLAWRLIRFLLANPDHQAPGVVGAVDLSVAPHSKAAQEVASLSHPDVALLRREVNEKTGRFFTEIRTDDVRRAIQLFQRGAGAGGYRICIVDSAEDLNRSSANALLKLIEEPPPLALFLLIAHRPGIVLPTIRSRSRSMRLLSLEPAEIVQVIDALGAPWSALPRDELAAAAARAHGSVAVALDLLDPDRAEIGRLIDRALAKLPALDWRAIYHLADQVTGRNAEDAFQTAVTSILDWIAQAADAEPGQSPRQLAHLAEVWETATARIREAEALNLDKRALILTIFADLAKVAGSID